MKTTKSFSFLLGFALAAVIFGAVSLANASSGNTIRVCADRRTGVMRYISGGSCRSTERSITWNQEGPRGLPGANGAKGDTGERGLQGPKGDTGSQGATGAAGPSGKLQTLLGSTVGRYWIERGTTCSVNLGNYGTFTSDSGSKFSICGLAVNDVYGSMMFGYADSLKAYIP